MITERLISSKKEDEKESEEPDYNEDKDQLEEEQEKKTGETEQETTINRVFLKSYYAVVKMFTGFTNANYSPYIRSLLMYA